MSLILGIDIDGTVTDPATFVPHLNKAFNKNLQFKDITQFHLPPLYEITDEQFWEWFVNNEGPIYAEAPLAQYAHQTINALASKHQLIYISARHERYFPLTKEWFAKNELPYHQIELLGKHDKIEVAKEQRVDLFFEDKLDNANAIAEELKIPVILFNTPYNQETAHQHIIRVHHWQEVLPIIKQHENT